MKTVAVEEKKVKEKATATIRLPKDAGVPAGGIGALSLDQQATIVLKGKVTSLSSRDWDDAKCVEVELSSCSMRGPEKKISLDEAMTESERRRE